MITNLNEFKEYLKESSSNDSEKITLDPNKEYEVKISYETRSNEGAAYLTSDVKVKGLSGDYYTTFSRAQWFNNDDTDNYEILWKALPEDMKRPGAYQRATRIVGAEIKNI